MGVSAGLNIRGVLQFSEVGGSTGLNVRRVLQFFEVGGSTGLNVRGILQLSEVCGSHAPDKFLTALAVLGAAWQYRSHFNLKVTSFQEQQSCSRSQECALGSSCLSQGGVQKQKHVFLSTFCG